MNQTDAKKQIAILNGYLFPFKKDELTCILSFIGRDKIPLHNMEMLFFENKAISGFYSLDFAESFNENHNKFLEKVASLSEAKTMHDVEVVVGSINFILKTGTNVRSKFPDIVNELRKSDGLSDEDKDVRMRLSNAIIIQENFNHDLQKIMDQARPPTFKSSIFSNKKSYELSIVKKFQAWEIVSYYIQGKSITSCDMSLEKEIKEIFNNGVSQYNKKKIQFSNDAEIVQKLFSGLDHVEKSMLNNSLEIKLENKSDLLNKKLKL